MANISTAVGLERKSRVSGYKIKKGVFNTNYANLPQAIVILGQANAANQATLNTIKKEITSSQEAGETYGYGSPIHQIMRILRPINSAGVGGIPTIVMPQADADGATQTSVELTVTGTATKNTTHTLVVNGRISVDFQNYSFTVNEGDTPTEIASKIADSINGVLFSPVSATSAAGVVTLTTKWKGATSSEINVSFDDYGDNAGITYAETNFTAGAGNVDLQSAFDQLGIDWFTCVINPYIDKLGEIEQFNGVPFGVEPTGNYSPLVFKPFVSFFGSTESDKDDLALITDDNSRIEQVTNVLCPAPNSEGFPWEAAANVCRVFSRIAQDTPHLDVNNKDYPDMPVPASGLIGDMSDYNNRDFLVRKGCSTVTLEKSAYRIQDLVTTYHPEGENPLQFAYPRNLNLDWNIKDEYTILEKVNVRDHVLVDDDQVTDAEKSVKPKQWQAVLVDFFDDLAVRALIREPRFSKDSLRVAISESNRDRFDTFFRYKRTGIARIESTDVEAGF